MSFVKMQMRSTRHLVASCLLPLVVILGYGHPYALVIGTVLFFLITSFKMLKSMLMWMIILGGISVLIPFLAPVILIIVIILFFARIGFILSNIRPFLSGVLLYGSLAFLIKRSFDLYSNWGFPILLPYIWRIWGDIGIGISSSDFIPILAEGIPAAVVLFVLLQLLTLCSYRAGHSSYVTYGVMGSAPLLIIALLLPFLKMGTDFFFEGATEAAPDTVPKGADHPGLVEVKGHARSLPSGEITWVDPHIRTAPDGTITNNLSYQGSQGSNPVEVAPNEGVLTESKPANAVIGERAKSTKRNEKS